MQRSGRRELIVAALTSPLALGILGNLETLQFGSQGLGRGVDRRDSDLQSVLEFRGQRRERGPADTVGPEGRVNLVAAPLQPEMARAVLDLQTPGNGQGAVLAVFEVRVWAGLAVLQIRGDLQSDVILLVLPQEDSRAVVRGRYSLTVDLPAG